MVPDGCAVHWVRDCQMAVLLWTTLTTLRNAALPSIMSASHVHAHALALLPEGLSACLSAYPASPCDCNCSQSYKATATN